MNQIKLKLSGITSLAEARFAAAAGIDYIGFCFDNTQPNYIPPLRAKEIFEWTSGSEVVAEFGNQHFDEIKDISELLDVNLIELESDAVPEGLFHLTKPLIKKINIDGFDEAGLKLKLEAYKSFCFAFHLFWSDDHMPEFIDAMTKEFNLILSMNNIGSAQAKSAIKPFAFNIPAHEDLLSSEEFNALLSELGK